MWGAVMEVLGVKNLYNKRSLLFDFTFYLLLVCFFHKWVSIWKWKPLSWILMDNVEVVVHEEKKCLKNEGWWWCYRLGVATSRLLWGYATNSADGYKGGRLYLAVIAWVGANFSLCLYACTLCLELYLPNCHFRIENSHSTLHCMLSPVSQWE